MHTPGFLRKKHVRYGLIATGIVLLAIGVGSIFLRNALNTKAATYLPQVDTYLRTLSADTSAVQKTYTEYPSLPHSRFGFLSAQYQQAERVARTVDVHVHYLDAMYDRNTDKPGALDARMWELDQAFYDAEAAAATARLDAIRVGMTERQRTDLSVADYRAHAAAAQNYLDELAKTTVYHALYHDAATQLKTALTEYRDACTKTANTLASYPPKSDTIAYRFDTQVGVMQAKIQRYTDFILSYHGNMLDAPPLVVQSLKTARAEATKLPTADLASLYAETSLRAGLVLALVPTDVAQKDYRARANTARVLLEQLDSKINSTSLKTDQRSGLTKRLHNVQRELTLYDDVTKGDTVSGGFLRQVTRAFQMQNTRDTDVDLGDVHQAAYDMLAGLTAPGYVEQEYAKLLASYKAALPDMKQSASLKKQAEALEKTKGTDANQNLRIAFDAYKLYSQSSEALVSGTAKVDAAKEQLYAIGAKADDIAGMNAYLRQDLDMLLVAIRKL